MIQVNVKCPECGASLMDSGRTVDGYPGIHTAITHAGGRADLWLSPVFGSYNVVTEAEVPAGAEVAFFCPHCGRELAGTRLCELCGARMARLTMREGGTIQICCRRGCPKHLVEFENPATEVAEFYRRQPYFRQAYLAEEEPARGKKH